MNNPSNPPNSLKTKPSIPANIKIPLFTFVILLVVGWLGLQSIQREFKKNLADQLHAVHRNSLEALQIWVKSKQALADVDAMRASKGLSRRPDLPVLSDITPSTVFDLVSEGIAILETIV